MDQEFSLDMAEQLLAELQQSMGGSEWADKENTPAKAPPPATMKGSAPTKAGHQGSAPSGSMNNNSNPDSYDFERGVLNRPHGGMDREDTGELVDIPSRLTEKPGTQAAMKDLERCSIAIAMKANQGEEDPNTCGRGDLFLRQKFFATTWKQRFATVVDHAYFGPVLFLFKYDKKGMIVAKGSQMIVLMDSEVRMADDVCGSDGVYRCQYTLKTKRKYTFACTDALTREYWIELLRSYA